MRRPTFWASRHIGAIGANTSTICCGSATASRPRRRSRTWNRSHAAASSPSIAFAADLDHIEGGVVVSGWEYAASGTPLYQLQDGVPRFATYYGPLAYLVEDLAPLLFQPSIAVSKLASLLALFATIAIMAAHFLVRRQSQGAWGGLFSLLAGCLFFVPVSFWVRPDPFETLLVAAGVALAANPIA